MGYNTSLLPPLIGITWESTNVTMTYGAGTLPPPPPPPQMDPNLMHILSVLHSYYQPTIMGLGLLMNLATFALLMGTKLSSFSSTRYLAACTLNDLIFLLILLITWLTERGFPLYRLGALCHVTTFFLESASFLSTWYTLCYSVDRFLATCLPGWEKQLCTTAKANIVIISIAILALVVFLNISLTVTVVRIGTGYVCMSVTSFRDALHVLKQINMFINIVTPYILIVLIWLTCSVRCYMNKRLIASRPVVSRNRVTLDLNSLGEGQNVTYLVYIAIFLLFTSPLQVEECRQTLREMADSKTIRSPLSSRLLLLKVPYYTRSSLNFMICAVSYRGFRSVLVMCARKLLKRMRSLLQKSRVVKTPDGGISLDDFQEEEESRVALCGNSPSKRDCIEL